MNFKINIFYVLLLSVFITSCSSDDVSSSQDISIVGLWRLDDVSLVELSMGGIDLISLLENSDLITDDLNIDQIIEDEFDEEIMLDFKADNTVTIFSEGVIEIGSYVINGDVVTITNDLSGEEQTLIIKTLNSDVLVFSSSFDGIDVSESGFPETLTAQPWNAVVDLTFNRL